MCHYYDVIVIFFFLFLSLLSSIKRSSNTKNGTYNIFKKLMIFIKILRTPKEDWSQLICFIFKGTW